MAVADLAASQEGAAEAGAHLVLIDESGAFLAPPVRRSLAPRGRTPILRAPGRKRQEASPIAALSLAPHRDRLGLHSRASPGRHITRHEAAGLMREVLRHLRGPVHAVRDRGDTHKGDAIRASYRDYPRLEGRWLPPYAPGLNPVEHAWDHLKYGKGADLLPRDSAELAARVEALLADARGDADRKRSFFKAARRPLRPRTLAT